MDVFISRFGRFAGGEQPVYSQLACDQRGRQLLSVAPVCFSLAGFYAEILFLQLVMEQG